MWTFRYNTWISDGERLEYISLILHHHYQTHRVIQQIHCIIHYIDWSLFKSQKKKTNTTKVRFLPNQCSELKAYKNTFLIIGHIWPNDRAVYFYCLIQTSLSGSSLNFYGKHDPTLNNLAFGQNFEKDKYWILKYHLSAGALSFLEHFPNGHARSQCGTMSKLLYFLKLLSTQQTAWGTVTKTFELLLVNSIENQNFPNRRVTSQCGTMTKISFWNFFTQQTWCVAVMG